MKRLPRHFLSSGWLQSLWLMLAGGRWTAQFPASIRRSLRWLVADGVLANTSDAILNTYQSVYLLSLGASRAEIGWLSSLVNLAMPAAMLPGGRLAARATRFKKLVVIPALIARLSLLGLIFLPFISSNVRLITLGIVLIMARAFLLNLLNPAWTSMLGGLVPAEWRGRYFSARNMLMGAASFVALLALGQVMDHLPQPGGYQVALGVALLAGLGATYAFAHIEEPPRERLAVAAHTTRRWAQRLHGQGRFLAFCATSGLWNFFVQIAGPFFIVFLATDVGASPSVVGLASAAAVIAALPGQRVFGQLADRKGARWVQRLAGFLVPLVPAIWGFIRQPWQAFPVQVLSGFAWAGYNLASFNLLLEMTPDEDRPTYVAIYQAFVGLCMAGGAALGGWIAQTQGYLAVFLTSAGGRVVSAALFALIVARPAGIPAPRLAVRWSAHWTPRDVARRARAWARAQQARLGRKPVAPAIIQESEEGADHGEISDGTTGLSRES